MKHACSSPRSIALRPLLSLDNAFNETDVEAFITRVDSASASERSHVVFSIEPKIDGISVSLRYEEGALVWAATRGDGVRGDEITEAIKGVAGVPMRLVGEDVPDLIEIRGELCMPHEVCVYSFLCPI